jgi:hypothetical protein
MEKSPGNKKEEKLRCTPMNTFAAPDGESHIYSTIQDVHDDIEDGLPLVYAI